MKDNKIGHDVSAVMIYIGVLDIVKINQLFDSQKKCFAKEI